MFQPLLDYFRDRSVLLLGFGREGRSTYETIRSGLPEKHLAIADRNPVQLDDPHVTLLCGPDYLSRINEFDLVMKSPGISVRDVTIDPGVEISCQTDLFLRFAPCTTVGVTGTKGKSTTSSLIYSILKADGREACLIGNIGVPVFEQLDRLDGMTAVIELSSHQLEFTKSSPHIAVLTNLYPEHLDHYHGYDGYVRAKCNIFRHQGPNDWFFYNPDQGPAVLPDLSRMKGNLVPISMTQPPAFDASLFSCNEHLKGEHNHHDILFAAAAARALGVENDAVERGVRAFAGIPHRMENVGTYQGVTFYNDAIATIPHAVLCAVDALETVDTLLIGGMDRGIDYSDFIGALAASTLRSLICLPETGHTIGRELIRLGASLQVYLAEDMEQAVSFAYHVTRPGHICLLSPAASSYNCYRNFEEKGNHFKELVRTYGTRE